MLVCPHCRTANLEESTTCHECGKELKPGRQSLGRRRESVSLIEVTPPPLPPRWRRIAAFGVVAAAIVAGAVWLAVKPGPCDGKYSSHQFDYCVAVPEGWASSGAMVGSVQVDQFVRAPARAFVLAVPLRPGTTVQTYAEIARTQDKQAGLTYGAIRKSRLGGEPALEWDLSLSEGSFRGIQVVAVTGETGWTVELNATDTTLASHEDPFRSMLSSWHFR